jgi:hypothetical protein
MMLLHGLCLTSNGHLLNQSGYQLLQCRQDGRFMSGQEIGGFNGRPGTFICVVIRMHEVSDLSVAELRELLGDR